MALIVSIAVLFAVIFFGLVAAAAGHRLLRILGLEFTSDTEHLLCSVALGVICIQVFLFFAQLSSHIRIGVATVLGLAVLLGLRASHLCSERLRAFRFRLFGDQILKKSLSCSRRWY